MELKNYLRILWQRKWVIFVTTFITLLVVAIGTYLATPIYQASTTLRVSVAASGLTSYYELNYTERLMNTYIEIVTSGPVLEELQRRLNLTKPPQINAEILPNTELIKITVEDVNPTIATNAANALAGIVVTQSDQFYSGSGKSQQEILSEQLAQSKAEIIQAQEAYDALITQIPPTQSPADEEKINTAKQSLESRQATYETLLEQFTTSGESQQKILGEQLNLIRTEIVQAQQDYDTLVTQIPPTQSPVDAEKINAANQSLDFKQKTYETLLDEYNSARLQEAMRANMLSVVEPAVIPDTPFKPKVFLNVALGLVIGLVVGIGLVFVFENLDTTLYTTGEIEAITNTTTLAKIPKANKKQLNISLNGYSPYAEAFRNLRVKLQLVNNQQLPKVLLIMSAEPKQGKSTIVSNLAFTLTKYGKKVVVIDADMRLPTLHRLFDVSNEYGLDDVLENQVELEKALQESRFDGVRVLTSGSHPADPLQLLGSPQMDKLIKSLCKQFDTILLDTPALLAGTDVAVLAPKVDSLMLVVRRTYAKRETVQAASKFLSEYPDKFIGLVVNQVEASNSYYYHEYKSSAGKKDSEKNLLESDQQDQ
jgi:capsular exopolysaccharide synthesis family protein